SRRGRRTAPRRAPRRYRARLGRAARRRRGGAPPRGRRPARAALAPRERRVAPGRRDGRRRSAARQPPREPAGSLREPAVEVVREPGLRPALRFPISRSKKENPKEPWVASGPAGSEGSGRVRTWELSELTEGVAN